MLVVGDKPLVVDVELSDQVWKPANGTRWIIVGVVVGIVALAGIAIAAMLYRNQTRRYMLPRRRFSRVLQAPFASASGPSSSSSSSNLPF